MIRTASCAMVGGLLMLAACGSGGSTGSGAGSSGGPPCTSDGPVLHLFAKNTRFSVHCLAAPANTPLAIEFENQDAGIPHTVGIFDGDPRNSPGAKELFTGDRVTGPKVKEYHVTALAAGTYHFQCDVHPDQMFGTFVVEP